MPCTHTITKQTSNKKVGNFTTTKIILHVTLLHSSVSSNSMFDFSVLIQGKKNEKKVIIVYVYVLCYAKKIF